MDSAVLITMIAIAIQRPGDGKIDATTKIDVATGFLAVTNIVFAYGRSSLNLLCQIASGSSLTKHHQLAMLLSLALYRK